MIHAIYAHFVMTPHAAVRAQQRGLKRMAIELAVALHDRVVAVGHGYQAWSVGRRRCAAPGTPACRLPSSSDWAGPS